MLENVMNGEIKKKFCVLISKPGLEFSINEVEKFVELCEKEGISPADAYIGIGEAFENALKLNSASKVYSSGEKTLSKKGLDFRAYKMKMMGFLCQGKFFEIEGECEPDLYQKRVNYEKAARAYKKGRNEVKTKEMWLKVGAIYEQRGLHEEAKEAYKNGNN